MAGDTIPASLSRAPMRAENNLLGQNEKCREFRVLLLNLLGCGSGGFNKVRRTRRFDPLKYGRNK